MGSPECAADRPTAVPAIWWPVVTVAFGKPDYTRRRTLMTPVAHGCHLLGDLVTVMWATVQRSRAASLPPSCLPECQSPHGLRRLWDDECTLSKRGYRNPRSIFLIPSAGSIVYASHELDACERKLTPMRVIIATWYNISTTPCGGRFCVCRPSVDVVEGKLFDLPLLLRLWMIYRITPYIHLRVFQQLF